MDRIWNFELEKLLNAQNVTIFQGGLEETGSNNARDKALAHEVSGGKLGVPLRLHQGCSCSILN